jgi:hypothetical protein
VSAPLRAAAKLYDWRCSKSGGYAEELGPNHWVMAACKPFTSDIHRRRPRCNLGPDQYGVQTLNIASFNMGRLVAAGAICEQETAAALIEQGQRIGLGTTECELTVASGMSAGIGEPSLAGSVSATSSARTATCSSDLSCIAGADSS